MLLPSPRTELEDTPLTLRLPHARGSFIVPSPGPPGVPAKSPPARLRQQVRQGRKILFFGGRALQGRCAQTARQPRGGVRATSPASPGGPRPPTGRRPSAGRSAGFRERVSAPLEGALVPHPSSPRPRGPRRAHGPGHELGDPSGLPSARPASPEPGVLHSGQARGRSLRPRALQPERSGAPRARPVASPSCDPPATGHWPPPTPPARARKRSLAPAPHLRRAPTTAHRPDRLCTPEVTSPGRPRPRPRRTPLWLRTQRLPAEPPCASLAGARAGAEAVPPPSLGTEDFHCRTAKARVEDKQREPIGPPQSSSVAWPPGMRGQLRSQGFIIEVDY